MSERNVCFTNGQQSKVSTFSYFQMYIALISAHALVLCGFQFFSCVRGQWTGKQILNFHSHNLADIKAKS